MDIEFLKMSLYVKDQFLHLCILQVKWHVRVITCSRCWV